MRNLKKKKESLKKNLKAIWKKNKKYGAHSYYYPRYWYVAHNNLSLKDLKKIKKLKRLHDQIKKHVERKKKRNENL